MTDDPLLARRVALRILDQVLGRRRPFDEVFAAMTGDGALDARDVAFVRSLVTTCLRRLGGIETVLARLIPKPLPPRARWTRQALRLGLAQILFQAVPDHAAVDSTVSLVATARQPADRALRGLANAVLRRAVRERAEILAGLEADPAIHLPSWLGARWRARFATARLARIARTLLEEPPLDLSLRDPRERAKRAAALGAHILPNGTLRLMGGGGPTALPGFADGAFWVQDAAAALAAPLVGDVGTVVDLCAAPGGKTLQLAARGAQVIAVDRSAARLARLRENLARTGLAAEIVVADALAWRPPAPVPAILLDAPCSATGTLRRHPDVGWLKGADDIARLADLQRRLLDHAADLLAPGGVMVYCVCSLEPEEGADQVAAFLARRADFSRQPIAAVEVAGLEAAVSEAGDVFTAPDLWAEAGGMDGFFIARLVRRH
ncbi:MAG: transcription antitermination factor NusB [Rhodothalassiaceae bacterium]